jgi:hypothetical protein
MEAVTFADITTGDGKRIQADCVGVHPSLTTHKSTWDFPVEHPSTLDKDRWRRGLLLISLATFEYPTMDTLGVWIVAPHQEWEWFYSPLDGGTLYQHAFSVSHK